MESLYAILEEYEKRYSNETIKWEEEEKQKYQECQNTFINCRKLCYEVLGAPIQVYADASEYGIGSYSCQVLEDRTKSPIDILSKTLTKADRRWPVLKKEAFAIFYALRM